MITIFCMILCVYFLIYGLLVMLGVHTPVRSKLLIEEDRIKLWCRAEGLTKMLWGIDAALFGVYYTREFYPTLFFIAFVLLTGYTIALTYKNNRKYMD